MTSLSRRWLTALLLSMGASACSHLPETSKPGLSRIDDTVLQAMAATGAKGLAIAVVDGGQVTFTKAYGVRDASGAPLLEDTVMYGASLTKAAFGYLVMQLVQEGRLGLDVPISEYLPQPLPSYSSHEIVRRYAAYASLAQDERWRRITPRILLTHSAGFSNFWFMEPDQKMRLHFDPGSRYAYSGDGFILLQFVLEQGLGLDVGAEMHRRLFEPNGMGRTSMIWRPDFRLSGSGQSSRRPLHADARFAALALRDRLASWQCQRVHHCSCSLRTSKLHPLIPMLTVASIDHIVLTVRSIPNSIAFYESVLGMKSVEFKPGRHALHFGRQKINLHEVGKVVDPNVKHAAPGSADICFITGTPLPEVLRHLQLSGVSIVQGPVRATGASAVLQSVYFYDPDENLIEVSNEI